MLRLPKSRARLRREAASWLARLRGSDPDAEAAFQAWHDARPDHAAAFARVSRSYEQAGLLRTSQGSASRSPAVLRREGSPTQPWRWAAAVALGLAVPAVWLIERPPGQPIQAVMLGTDIGEIRRVELADGSLVTLDTATQMIVDIGRDSRHVRLDKGRARFQVAPAAAPFTVETGATSVSSNGGTVDVEADAERPSVAVLSGTAEMRVDGGGLDGLVLSPGDRAAAAAQGIRRLPPDAGEREWTRGMLMFEGTPLKDAVERANSYSRRRILLADGIGDLRVTGAFRAGDTTGLARTLVAAFGLAVEQRRDGSLLLSRPH